MAGSASELKFDAALREHADAISRYCLRRLPVSEVNDVVAQVFVVAWRKIDVMPAGAASLPWLYAVARNEVLRAHRGAARRARLNGRMQREPVYPAAAPEAVVVRQAEVAELMAALATLKPEDREVLLLRSHEDLSVKEISAVLGCSFEAAKKRLSRATSRLRKAAGLPRPQAATGVSRATEEGGGTA